MTTWMRCPTILGSVILCPVLFAQNPVSVEGTVIDRLTRLGIPGAAVHFRSGNRPDYEVLTDGAGHFQISGMEDGQYGVRVEKTGYVPEDSAAGDAALQIIRVAAGQEPEQIQAELSTYARLRGHVLDPGGAPLAKVTVTYAHGFEVSSSQRQVTDEQGRFEFSNVVPGSYVFEAVPARAAGSKPEGGAGEDRIELQPTWYPAATERNTAERVVLHGGADLAGYDIHMQASPVYRVRGILLGEDGKPVSGGMVIGQSGAEEMRQFGIGLPKPSQIDSLSYFTLAGAAGQNAQLIRTRADGSFEFPSVPRGPRQFRALEGLNSKNAPRPPAIVTAVVDHDIDDLEIRMLPAFAIEAATELDGVSADQTPAAVRNARVELSGVGQSLIALNRTGNRARFGRVAPGAVRIAAAPGLAGGYYLDSIQIGGQDATWKPVNVQAGLPPARIVYKPNAGTVRGTVESTDGATVVLVPQSALDAADVQYGRAAPRKNDGTFEIDSVGPGSYYVFAVDGLEPETFANASDIRKIVNAATVVQITEGATAMVKVNTVHFDN